MIGEERIVELGDSKTHPRSAGEPLSSWIERARALVVGAVELDVEAQADLELRDPLNTVVRGLLGERLRDLWCLTGAPSCEGCEARASCSYARVFETPASLVQGAHGSHGPHPFWLGGVPAVHTLARGARFTARISAVGPDASGTLAYLELGLRDALRTIQPTAERRAGSRAHSSPRRGAGGSPPRLVQPLGRWLRVSAPRIRPAGPLVLAAAARERLSLYVVTPLILGELSDRAAAERPRAPWLPLVVRAGVRRISALTTAYAGASRERALLPALDEMRVEGDLSEWFGSRFSVRQGRRHPLAGDRRRTGWVGAAELSGPGTLDLARFFHVLSIVGVGNKTSMGFGDLDVR